MTSHICRRGLTIATLTLIGILAHVFVLTAQEDRSRQTTPEFHQVTSAVQGMQVIVRHRDDRKPPHTYSHFAPTQVRMDADSLVIVGTIAESPANETADITVRMQTSGLQAMPRRGDVSKPYIGKAWYEDEDLREFMERE